jgi:hypothetical protein
MYILTLLGKEDEGAYAVKNSVGEKVLFMFEEMDDAVRYALQLEDINGEKMHVLEVEGKNAIMSCEKAGYEYAIITPNDIVIPPDDLDD